MLGEGTSNNLKKEKCIELLHKKIFFILNVYPSMGVNLQGSKSKLQIKLIVSCYGFLGEGTLLHIIQYRHLARDEFASVSRAMAGVAHHGGELDRLLHYPGLLLRLHTVNILYRVCTCNFKL